jgi:hypothetical protein
VKNRETINAGLIVSEPFVTSNQRGFALELFKHLADLMELKYNTVSLTVEELELRLAQGEVDIVVGGLLPTFRRQRFMTFSRPFPYLGVALSGLIGTRLLGACRTQFDAEQLLNSAKEVVDCAKDAKLMVVKGSAGQEFFEAFFDPDLRDLLQVLHSPEDFDPKTLWTSLQNAKPDLFLADIGTCRAVLLRQSQDPSSQGLFTPIGDSKEMKKIDNRPEVEKSLAQLAMYRVAFGLPREDIEWKRSVNSAFEFLLTEGIRTVLALYRRYSDTGKLTPFLFYPDDTVRNDSTRRYFRAAIPDIAARGSFVAPRTNADRE